MEYKLSDSELENEDENDPRYGLAFGHDFLEKFLLAIIKAHPLPTKSKELSREALSRNTHQRLNLAMEVLVGRKVKVSYDIDEDAPLLTRMAVKRHKEMAKISEYRRQPQEKKLLRPQPKRRSDRLLANLVVSKVSGVRIKNFGAEHCALRERLREKFSGAYWRKQSKGQDIQFELTWSYMANERDYIMESLQYQGLRKIEPVFASWGIKLSLD